MMLVGVWIFMLSVVGPASATSLTGQLDNLAFNLSQQVLLVGTGPLVLGNPQAPPYAHSGFFFQNALPGNQLALSLKAAAFQAADFPVTSTAPGFSYLYNPELNTFERRKGSLGPVFAERAETTGKGRFDVGFFYLREKFREFDNEDLEGFSEPSGHGDHNVVVGGVNVNDVSGEKMTISYDKFNLASDVFSFFGTYGITDRWDVNLLVPVLRTSLSVRQTARITGKDTTLSNEQDPVKHQFLLQGSEQNGIRVSKRSATGSVSDTAVGVGDIFLRTKYRLTDGEVANVAGAFTLRLPTGNQDNFQGGGDVTLWPAVIASRAIGPHEVHGNLGVEFDPETTDRSRLQYAVGGSIQLVEWLSGIIDMVGSSQFADQEVETTVRVPVSNGPLLEPTTRQQQETVTVPRTDVVNLSLGLKAGVFGSGVVFATVVIPLVNTGLRPGVVPVVGFEYGF